jgi:hypothetical protein
MILIAHRGNINGKMEAWENEPTYLDLAIAEGYDVEIDIWRFDDKLFLGHDSPQCEISISWINDRSHRLWVHCKNADALVFFNKLNSDINYFWHENDTLTLTSKNYIWAFPGKQPIQNSIAVLPELYDDNLEQCIGICSDFIQKYTNIK